MKTVQNREKTQTECHEIEPDPSKNRGSHEGDNPSFEIKVVRQQLK
jgi:hypothetical protein